MLTIYGALRSCGTGGQAIPCLIFALAFFLLISPMGLRASIPTEDIPYGVTYPGGSFSSGETVTLAVWAGSTSEPLDSVSGLDLTFELTEDAVFPTALSLDWSQSWLATGTTMDVTITLDEEAKTIRIQASRAAGYRSGDGELFSFSLITATSISSANQLMLNSGSGIIITIDDLIMRQAAPQGVASVSLSLYPNPAQDKLITALAHGEMAYLEIWDAQGRRLVRTEKPVLQLRALGLTPGRYWVRAHTTSGEVVTKPLLLQP
ncbi:MAG: T9SS type A sorting domain-containing protein [Bacteroidota bacterium]